MQHGHMTGSKTLQEVARRMILTVRGIDKVVRYGGDEFCVVLPETDSQGAFQVAERIRNAIASKPVVINENIQVSITGSIGIASYPTHAHSKDELVRQADKAMFVIKKKAKMQLRSQKFRPANKQPKPRVFLNDELIIRGSLEESSLPELLRSVTRSHETGVSLM